MVFAENLSVFRSVTPMVYIGREFRAESFRFPFPIFQKGGGADHKGGVGNTFFLSKSRKKSEGLKCFSEPHFICKNSSKLVAEKVEEPSYTGSLVGPKGV